MPGEARAHAAVMTTTLLDRAPLAPSPPGPPRARLRRMRYEPEPGTAPGPERARAGTGPTGSGTTVSGPVVADPDSVRRALSGPLRLAMEVLDGRRPPAHLTHHFAPAPMRYWRVASQQRRFRAPSRMLRVLLCLPRAGAAEISAVCEIDGRVRALAARFEQRDAGGPWRCTALRLG